MSKKYLDNNGLQYFWTKIKNYIDSHITGTKVPTADTTAMFDTAKHMNSEDMTEQELANYLEGIPRSNYNAVQKSGDTMTGDLEFAAANEKKLGIRFNETKTGADIGWSYSTQDGAGIGFRSTDWNVEDEKGAFYLYARSSVGTKALHGKTNGLLMWDGREIPSILERKIYNGTNGNVWGIKWVDGRMTIDYYFHTLTKSHYATWNNMNGYYHTINWNSDIGWNFKDTNYSVSYAWTVGSGYALNAGGVTKNYRKN